MPEQTKTELRAARLDAYVKRTVAAMRPLTDDQIQELAILLRGGDRVG